MMSIGDVMRYVPGVTVHQGENNRDQVIIRGNSSSADFFVDGVRDDVQYYRDLYNLDRVEALKGPNAHDLRPRRRRRRRQPREQGGRLRSQPRAVAPGRHVRQQARHRRTSISRSATRSRSAWTGCSRIPTASATHVDLERYGVTPTVTIAPGDRTKVSLRYEYLNDTRVADRGITSFQGLPADVDRSRPTTATRTSATSSAHVNVLSGTVEHRASGFAVRNHTSIGELRSLAIRTSCPGAVTADKRQVALTAYNNATDRTNLFNQTDVTSTVTTGPIRHTLLAGAEFGRQLTDNFRNTGFFNNTSTSILVPVRQPRRSRRR